MEDEDEPAAWPAEPAVLRALDQSVRCPICHDFLDCPVSLNCGHSFCCTCITSNLEFQMKNRSSSKPSCPSCRENADLLDLRKNLTLQQAVICFKNARPTLLCAVRAKPDAGSQRRDEHSYQYSMEPGPVIANSEIQTAGRKRPRLPRAASTKSRDLPCKDVCIIDDVEIEDGSRPTDGDSDFEHAQSSGRGRHKSTSLRVPRVEKYQCPLCYCYFEADKINQHANTCLVRQSNNKSVSKVRGSDLADMFLTGKGKADEPMKVPPKMAFHLFKARELQNHLSKMGIPTSKDGKESTKALAEREVLISRYNNVRMEIKKAVEFGNPESLSRRQIIRKVLQQERSIIEATKSCRIHASQFSIGAESSSHADLISDTKTRMQNRRNKHVEHDKEIAPESCSRPISLTAVDSNEKLYADTADEDDDHECQVVENGSVAERYQCGNTPVTLEETPLNRDLNHEVNHAHEAAAKLIATHVVNMEDVDEVAETEDEEIYAVQALA